MSALAVYVILIVPYQELVVIRFLDGLLATVEVGDCAAVGDIVQDDVLAEGSVETSTRAEFDEPA